MGEGQRDEDGLPLLDEVSACPHNGDPVDGIDDACTDCLEEVLAAQEDAFFDWLADQGRDGDGPGDWGSLEP